MTFAQARKHLAKVGASHATGEALAVIYAEALELHHGGHPERYYAYLCSHLETLAEEGQALIHDRAKAWDVLMGIPEAHRSGAGPRGGEAHQNPQAAQAGNRQGLD